MYKIKEPLIINRYYLLGSHRKKERREHSSDLMLMAKFWHRLKGFGPTPEIKRGRDITTCMLTSGHRICICPRSYFLSNILGKRNRGLSVIGSLRHLVSPDELAEDDVKTAVILGWCVEWVRS